MLQAYGVKQDRDLWWRVTDTHGRIIRAWRGVGWSNLYRTKAGALAKARALNRANPSL